MFVSNWSINFSVPELAWSFPLESRGNPRRTMKVKPSKTDGGRIVKLQMPCTLFDFFKELEAQSKPHYMSFQLYFPLYKPYPFSKPSQFKYLIAYISSGEGSRQWRVRRWTWEGGLGLWRRTFFSSTMSLLMEKGDGTPSPALRVYIDDWSSNERNRLLSSC